MFDLRDILPTEALLPSLAGAAVWFGANYAVIAPDVIAPRLIELRFAPACHATVAQGQDVFAAREKSLVEGFNASLDEQANAARNRVAQGSQQALEMAFGAMAPEMMTLFGDQLLGSTTGMVEMQLGAELDNQRASFMAELNAQRAAAQNAVIYQTAEEYCGCVLSQVLGEDRFDLAAYTASLRFFTPPLIRNIESGAIYNTPLPTCGAMPIL